jgi:tyrosyl-DNA phosphodiesterase-1
MADFPDNERPSKRARISESSASTQSPADEYNWSWPCDLVQGNTTTTAKPTTISPPPLSRKQQQHQRPVTEASPFQLTKIRDLADSANVDTVTLSDILGHALIKEVWIFNFLIDIEFVLEHLDRDVRDTVLIKIVHGFHEKSSSSRTRLEASAAKYVNVQTLHTWVPAYGTHHSKMMVLLRHDDAAQLVIHTANMIRQDWTNLTQAVWRSPLLPLSTLDHDATPHAPIGSGARFKQELVNYLEAYKDKYRDITRPLIDKVKKYDFSSIKAALVASVPGKQRLGNNAIRRGQSLWGWLGLKQALENVSTTGQADKAQINMQVSSIATASEKWLAGFINVMATTASGEEEEEESTPTTEPWVRVIFPTADEIRRSLDGYRSGSSIHMKLDSQTQKQQLQFMKPLFCTWAGDKAEQTAGPVREAGRRRAAPHIKTYMRFSNDECNAIDWAMLTSANLSKQAWGEMANKQQEVSIKSFEIGVLVCPQWCADEGQKVAMVPVFKKDMPGMDALLHGVDKLVGVRMPYDLPLSSYSEDEEPWCAERWHMEPDWTGVSWQT